MQFDKEPKSGFKEKIKKVWIIFCGIIFLTGTFIVGGYANNIGVAYKKIELKGSQAMLESAIQAEMNAKAVYHEKLESRKRQQASRDSIVCEIATMNAKISVAKNKAINHKDYVDSNRCVNQPEFLKAK